jgi:hypothetical protein
MQHHISTNIKHHANYVEHPKRLHVLNSHMRLTNELTFAVVERFQILKIKWQSVLN